MTVLACVDDSAVAPRVVAHAVSFARALNTPLHLMRVMDPQLDVARGPNPDSDAEMIAAVRSLWEQKLQDLLANAGGSGEIRVYVLPPGDTRVHDAIARVASSLEAKAIVMGSHGAGIVRHTVLGSVAMGVVGAADRPVLITGPKCNDTPPDDREYIITVSDDGSETSHAATRAVERLVDQSRLKIRLLSVYEPRLGDGTEREEHERLRRELEQLAESAGFDPGQAEVVVQTVHDFERVDSAIIRIAGELESDAISMATRGHSLRHRLLAGSVAVGVLKHSPLPVLLVGASR